MTRRVIICALVCLAAITSLAARPATVRLPGGCRVVTLPTTTAQVVSVVALIDYSALDEPRNCPGMRKAVVLGMLLGSAATPGTAIRKVVTDAGGTLDWRIHSDAVELAVTLPAASLEQGMAALAEFICRPAFTDAGIQRMLAEPALFEERQPSGAAATARQLSHELIYSGHPYGPTEDELARARARMTPAMVRNAHKQYVVPTATVVSIVGRGEGAEMNRLARKYFGDWAGADRLPRLPADAPALKTSQTVVKEARVGSTCVMLAFPACGSSGDDFITLRLIDNLLGGGTGSRLFRGIREDRKLAYDTSSAYPNQADCSDFTIYALTVNRLMEEAKVALVEELARLQTEKVPDDELKRAKAFLSGRYLLSHQYSSQHAFDLAWYEIQGLGAGYDEKISAAIDKITAGDIQRVAKKYFTHYYLIVVMPRTFSAAPAN